MDIQPDPIQHPKYIIVETQGFIQTFEHTVRHLRLSPVVKQEIYTQVLDTFMEDIRTSLVCLQRLPDFSRLHAPQLLDNSEHESLIKRATIALGEAIYAYLRELGGYEGEEFPYFLHRLLNQDIVLQKFPF